MELVKPGEYAVWAKESLKLSIDVVYNNFKPGQIPSKEYKDKALPILEERIMFGGERLAEIVRDVYGGKSMESSFEEEVFLQ